MAQKQPVQATKTEHYRSYTVKEHQRKMYERVYKFVLRRMRSRSRKEKLCRVLSELMATNVMEKRVHVVGVNSNGTD